MATAADCVVEPALPLREWPGMDHALPLQGHRWCRGCGRLQPFAMYAPSSLRVHRNPLCRTCVRQYQRAMCGYQPQARYAHEAAGSSRT